MHTHTRPSSARLPHSRTRAVKEPTHTPQPAGSPPKGMWIQCLDERRGAMTRLVGVQAVPIGTATLKTNAPLAVREQRGNTFQAHHAGPCRYACGTHKPALARTMCAVFRLGCTHTLADHTTHHPVWPSAFGVTQRHTPETHRKHQVAAQSHP